MDLAAGNMGWDISVHQLIKKQESNDEGERVKQQNE